ncbi:hypothetical protein ACEN2I_13575, partial [Flavobacterium sp. W22_SRS_FK3]
MKKTLLRSKILIAFLFFVFLLLGNTVFSQTTGDYRSVATGNWTTLSSWQYYNGSTWVIPSGTSPQGYPGQYTGTGAVFIQAGHKISIGTSGITTNTMGTVTISGTLSLTGISTGSGTVYEIKTNKLVVTPGLSPAATISFEEKVSLVLSANAELQVSTGGLSTVGSCNANQEIQIGSTKITSCTGSTKFSDTMSQGGYNASCSTFSLTSVTATGSCASPGTSTVTVSGTSSGLPIGNYTVEYRLSYDSYTTVYNGSMIVNTAGSGTFNANVSVVNVTSSTRIKIYKLTSGSCTSNLSSNNESNVSYKYTTLGKPSVNSGYGACSIWKAQWNNESSDGYYFDVSTTNNFATGTFLPGFQNLQIVGYPSSYDITGLTPGNTYYYRIRSYNYCGTSVNSNVITFVAQGIPAPIVGSITQPSCSTPTGSFTITNYNSAIDYGYSISPSAGSRSGANISGLPAGNYILYSSGNGCTSSTSFTINAVGASISYAGSPYCKSLTTPQSVTLVGSTGGTYSASPSGLSINSSTGDITPSTSITGSYTVTYNRPVSCPGVNPTTSVTISAVPTASISYSGSPYCKSLTASQPVTQTGTTGGTYSAPAGLIINSSTGEITPSTSTVGSYTVTYTYGLGACTGLTTTATVVINSVPVTAGMISGAISVCQGQVSVGYSVPAITNATSYAWSYSGTGATFTNGTTRNPTITFAANATAGNLTVYGVNSCGNGTVSANYAITVNPSPTPTFTTPAQTQTCANEHITYTTQSGQSNYVWTVSGVLNTDYRLIARGTNTNRDIVIEWLTAGTKTVTVNYSNSNGCNGATAASYTTQVTVVDRGRVIGGAHICKGSSLPTLTLRNDAGNSVYPDSSSILIWQYSDELNNTNWQDIAGTAGQTSYTPTAFSGAFRTYQVLLKNGICTKTSIESRINIDAFNAPTLGTTTYPTCSVSTGSVVLNNLPTGNWTINQTGTVTKTYPNTIANTTSYTVTGLTAGTYTFTVKEGSCTSDASSPIKIQAGNTWDGTKWSKTGNTTLPTAGDVIVFEGNYTLSSDLTSCSCIVNSGDVVISAGKTLNITNAVTVNGGSLTFENNASLVQINDVNNNSGPITYKRNSQPMKNFDYTYWSSPVEGQTFYNLSPNTLWDKYLSFTGTVWREELGASAMQPGIGYIIRVPKPNSVYPNGKDYWTGTSYTQQVEFIGKPNNGNITSSQYMEKDKYYLIGNPYPSAIHADDFLYSNVNNRGILGGTIYLWTHNTAIKIVNSKLAYVSDDYASYNLTGGTATRAAVSPGANTDIPQGYIAAGQS